MKRLTNTKIQAITKQGRHGDGNGLYLFVARGGSKSWVQRVVIHGKRRDIGLGGFPQVSLADARLVAAYNRRLARVYKMDPTQADADRPDSTRTHGRSTEAPSPDIPGLWRKAL